MRPKGARLRDPPLWMFLTASLNKEVEILQHINCRQELEIKTISEKLCGYVVEKVAEGSKVLKDRIETRMMN